MKVETNRNSTTISAPSSQELVDSYILAVKNNPDGHFIITGRELMEYWELKKSFKQRFLEWLNTHPNPSDLFFVHFRQAFQIFNPQTKA